MKFSCNKQDLMEAVSNVGRAVAAKAGMPELEGILFKAHGKTLFMAGFDMDIGITTSLEADIAEDGDIVIPARLFGDIVRRLPTDQVSVASDGKYNTIIKSGVTEFSIVGFSAEEYPELPSVNDGVHFTVSQPLLKSMIRQTLFAVSRSDARPVHTGTQFEVAENHLRLVSVDGSRLAMRSEPVKSEQDMKFVIPGKTLSEVLKLLSDEDTAVSMSVGRRHIVMEIGNYAVISRLLDGEFLPYQKAIPQSVTTTVTVNTRDMIDAVERASLVISDRTRSHLICDFKTDGAVNVSCVTTVGSMNDSISATVAGESIEMGFNSQFMLDALKNAECDQIKIELAGNRLPLKIVPTTGDSFLFLVLPVILKNR